MGEKHAVVKSSLYCRLHSFLLWFFFFGFDEIASFHFHLLMPVNRQWCTIMAWQVGWTRGWPHTNTHTKKENPIQSMAFHFYLCHFLYWLLTLTFFSLFYFSFLFTVCVCVCVFPLFVHFKPKTPIRNVVRFSSSCKMKWNEIKIRFCVCKKFFPCFVSSKKRENGMSLFSFCKNKIG